VGEQNEEIMEDLCEKIRKFMELKPIPDWMTEEKLKESYDRAQGTKKRTTKKKQ
jgi:hypothetical protein